MVAWWWSWLLAGVGLAGLWLAGSQRRVGWLVGVGAQLLWIAYAVVSGQPGFVLSALGYGAVHARNWWRWRAARPAGGDVNEEADVYFVEFDQPRPAGCVCFWRAAPAGLTRQPPPEGCPSHARAAGG